MQEFGSEMSNIISSVTYNRCIPCLSKLKCMQPPRANSEKGLFNLRPSTVPLRTGEAQPPPAPLPPSSSLIGFVCYWSVIDTQETNARPLPSLLVHTDTGSWMRISSKCCSPAVPTVFPVRTCLKYLNIKCFTLYKWCWCDCSMHFQRWKCRRLRGSDKNHR